MTRKINELGLVANHVGGEVWAVFHPRSSRDIIGWGPTLKAALGHYLYLTDATP